MAHTEKRIRAKDIRTDGGTQSRVSMDQAIVDDYAEHIFDLPNIDVFFDGVDHWLADGFYRHRAHRQAGGDDALIDCNVHSGLQRDAVLFSVGANAKHGLRRSNADKHKAVTVLLTDAEWAAKSDRWIAEQCGVSAMFVGTVRKEATAVPVSENTETIEKSNVSESGVNGLHLKKEVEVPEKRAGKDGKNYPTAKPRRTSAADSQIAPDDDGSQLNEASPEVSKESDDSLPDELPWERFNNNLDQFVSELRSISKRLGEFLQADAKTKRLMHKFAHFIAHGATVGAINQIIRYLESSRPAATADESPGYISAELVEKRTAFAKAGGK